MRLRCFLVLMGIVVAGCSPDSGDTASNDSIDDSPANSATDSTADAGDPSGDPARAAADSGGASDPSTSTQVLKPETDNSGTPSPAGKAQAEGDIPLTPENTRIQFVGTHAGDKPDPRTGTFGKFAGTAKVAGGALTTVSVEIETASLSTEIPKLTDHLKSPDFFEVRQHPKATFQSTGIEDAGDGTVKITGDLTLRGITRSISFPATVSTADGLSLKAEFTVDRTDFGMNYGVDKVEKPVAMTVTVGK